MAKRNEAVALLRSGRYLEEIASDMAVSFQTVVRYMKLQVAEGALKISDVYFGLRPSRRDALERCSRQQEELTQSRYYRAAESHGFSWDEANLYWSLRENRISRGDMYEHIADSGSGPSPIRSSGLGARVRKQLGRLVASGRSAFRAEVLRSGPRGGR